VPEVRRDVPLDAGGAGARVQEAAREKAGGTSGVNDAQLYLAIGLPTVTALVGILVNIGYFIVTNGRISRLEDKIDLLTGKVAEVDTQMARVKEHLGMKP
jgi:hypothetical protein